MTSPTPPVESPLVQQIRGIAPKRVVSEIGGYAARWRNVTDPAERLAVARAILERLDAANLPMRWRSGRAWVHEIQRYVDQAE